MKIISGRNNSSLFTLQVGKYEFRIILSNTNEIYSIGAELEGKETLKIEVFDMEFKPNREYKILLQIVQKGIVPIVFILILFN